MSARLCPDHLSVRVGGSSRRGEEIVKKKKKKKKNLESRLSVHYLFIYFLLFAFEL